jgi:hypothetical protein
VHSAIGTGLTPALSGTSFGFDFNQQLIELGE